MSNSDRPISIMRNTLELDMFLVLPGKSDGTYRYISLSSVDWWCQIGLGGPGTYSTRPKNLENPFFGGQKFSLYPPRSKNMSSQKTYLKAK